MHGPQKSRYFNKAVVEKLHLNSTIGLLDITKEIQMNKQFKVGDVVERKDDTLSGTRVEVTNIKKQEWIGIRYLNGQFKGLSAEWYTDKAKLVHEQVCKFVPGNTYKDRTGKEYRFVIYAKEAAPQWRAVFLTSSGNVTCRRVDGSVNISGSRWSEDILPTKEMRAVSVYKTPSGGYACQWTASPECPLGSVPADWKKIGEVVEEYETY